MKFFLSDKKYGNVFDFSLIDFKNVIMKFKISIIKQNRNCGEIVEFEQNKIVEMKKKVNVNLFYPILKSYLCFPEGSH